MTHSQAVEYAMYVVVVEVECMVWYGMQGYMENL